MLGPRLVVGRRGDGDGGDLVEVEALVGRGVAEDGAEDAVEGGDLRRVGDEHGARRPVQPPAADRAHERQRAGEVGQPRRASPARRRRAGAGRTRRPARGRSSSIVSTPKAARQSRLRTSSLEAGRADHLLVLAVLEHRAERAVDRARRRGARRRAGSAPRASRSPRRSPAASARRCRACARPRRRPARPASATRPCTRRRTISTSRCGRRVVDPVVQAAALDRVVQVARAVGGEHDDRRVRGADRADLGDRHAGLGQQLEQERLEVVVGAVDLVDQQHRRPRAGVLERAQQRPPDQVVRAEQVLLAQRRRRSRRRAGC